MCQPLDSNKANLSLSEDIGLKDSNGQYRYVNPALADAAGRAQKNLVEFNDSYLTGHSRPRTVSALEASKTSTGGRNG